MKNKEFINICYSFINRAITVNKLIEKLENINTEGLAKKDINAINKLLDEIKKIEINNPNKEDELVIFEKDKREKSAKIRAEISEKLDIFADYNNNQDKEIDSYDRWSTVFNCISENEYFNTCMESLSDYELLEFIAQNISAPLPPFLNQEEFENLVKAGIEKDEREWLWRLAFNYDGKNINFDSIENYFIKVKDGYYLQELISVVGDSLDIDKLIDKINDKDLINDLLKRKAVIDNYVTEEHFNKLRNRIKE